MTPRDGETTTRERRGLAPGAATRDDAYRCRHEHARAREDANETRCTTPTR